MEPVFIPKISRWSDDDKAYKKAIKDLKMYLAESLLMSEEEFDDYFALDSTDNYVTLRKRREYGRYSYKKRFSKGKVAMLNFDEIESLIGYIEAIKEKRKKEEIKDKITEKGRKILKKILDKYDYTNEDKNDGFVVDFDYSADYENSLYIRYYPINDLKLNDENDKFLLSGYFINEKDDWKIGQEFEDYHGSNLPDSDDGTDPQDLNEDDIISEIDKGENTSFDFVITSYRKDDNFRRFSTDVVNMNILLDGNFSTPNFDLPRNSMDTLDNIIKISDKCIEWQIDIIEFAEKLKSEIDPKFWELQNLIK